MEKVLIDTDVILDFFFDRMPFSGYAAQIFSLCESDKIKGYVTPVICSNVYYLLKLTSTHDKVIKKLSQLLSIMDVLSMDKDIVLQALGSGFKDFEDALQNFSAIKSGFIDLILTRNIKDYLKSELGVLTPENYIKSLTARR
jgi:predicted nucleic acid-binding protein